MIISRKIKKQSRSDLNRTKQDKCPINLLYFCYFYKYVLLNEVQQLNNTTISAFQVQESSTRPTKHLINNPFFDSGEAPFLRKPTTYFKNCMKIEKEKRSKSTTQVLDGSENRLLD